MVSSQCEESHWDTPNLQEVENKGPQTGAAIELSAGTLLSSPTVSGLSGSHPWHCAHPSVTSFFHSCWKEISRVLYSGSGSVLP